MTDDPYKDFAERYDWMKVRDLDREEFFGKLLENHNAGVNRAEQPRQSRWMALSLPSQRTYWVTTY
jgi:hypothetical protein